MSKKASIYMTDKTLDAIGSRVRGSVVNQTMQRLTVAIDEVEITKSDRKFYELNRRKDRSPGYPDQSEILKKFASQKGCDLSTALVCLEKMDRE